MSPEESWKFAAVEGGSRPVARGTKDPVSVTYPKYVLGDLFQTPVSLAHSASGGLHASLLFTVEVGIV